MGNLYYYRNGSAMNLIWTTSLRVFPQHCNHHNGMIFGGEILEQMDLAAAAAVARFLYDSPNGVSEALTVGVDKVTFHKGAKVGDLIIFTAKITEIGKKRITVNVSAERERLDTIYQEVEQDKNNPKDFVGCEFISKKKVIRDKMAEGIFHFCAYDMEKGKGTEHGMTLNTAIHWKCGLPTNECDCASIIIHDANST